MELYKIIVMPDAEKDKENIVRYLSDFSLNIAVKYADDIDETMKTLETMPSRRPLVRNERLRALGFRWIDVRNYIVFFRVENNPNIVRIERILYSAQEYDLIL